MLISPLSFQCDTFYSSFFSGTSAHFEIAYVDLTEIFFIELRITLVFSILVYSPFVWLQMLFFVWDSLYWSERRVLFVVILGSCVSIFLTSFFCFSLLLPYVWGFFSVFNQGLSNDVLIFKFLPVMGPYVSVCLSFLLTFVAFFQVPVVFTLAVYWDIFDVVQLVSFRKFVYIGLLLLSSFLSPPDVFSQLCLSVPLFLFYEFLVLFLVLKCFTRVLLFLIYS
jgi:sec-independent protein translocase protein TatC